MAVYNYHPSPDDKLADVVSTYLADHCDHYLAMDAPSQDGYPFDWSGSQDGSWSAGSSSSQDSWDYSDISSSQDNTLSAFSSSSFISPMEIALRGIQYSTEGAYRCEPVDPPIYMGHAAAWASPQDIDGAVNLLSIADETRFVPPKAEKKRPATSPHTKAAKSSTKKSKSKSKPHTELDDIKNKKKPGAGPHASKERKKRAPFDNWDKVDRVKGGPTKKRPQRRKRPVKPVQVVQADQPAHPVQLGQPIQFVDALGPVEPVQEEEKAKKCENGYLIWSNDICPVLEDPRTYALPHMVAITVAQRSWWQLPKEMRDDYNEYSRQKKKAEALGEKLPLPWSAKAEFASGKCPWDILDPVLVLAALRHAVRASVAEAFDEHMNHTRTSRGRVTPVCIPAARAYARIRDGIYEDWYAWCSKNGKPEPAPLPPLFDPEDVWVTNTDLRQFRRPAKLPPSMSIAQLTGYSGPPLW